MIIMVGEIKYIIKIDFTYYLFGSYWNIVNYG
jgi:hypothetical protein